jgi:deoxycitidine kinase/deoxyguanosine kinase
MTDYNIFAKMLYDEGKLNEIEFQIYKRYFDEFVEEVECIVKTVYLRCEPEISHHRVEKRAREGEVIPLTYLQQCHEYHERWLDGEADLVIDCSTDISLDESNETMVGWIHQIVDLFPCEN